MKLLTSTFVVVLLLNTLFCLKISTESAGFLKTEGQKEKVVS